MSQDRLTFGQALARHWPEYLIEACGLGTFMVSAGLFATLLESPTSPVHRAIENADVRRALMGVAMGLTAIGIIYSPWGNRSGAHINPAVTLTFLWLGKVKPADALFYIVSQFVGGSLGVLAVWAMLGEAFSEPPVQFAATMPGPPGPAVAFIAEAGMAWALMLMVLTCMQAKRLASLIGVFAGAMVAFYITVLAPVSGFSINPARSFASAAPGLLWDFLWIYGTAPVIGMLAAVETFRLGRFGRARFCAKLNHNPAQRCIHCGYEPARAIQAGDAGRLDARAPEPETTAMGMDAR